MKVGFIGLGLMGNPMAKNLLKAGFKLTVYNRTKDKAKELESLGAKIASSPAEVGLNSEVIITMVTGPKDVRAVLFDKDGVVDTASSGSIVIDMSTIGPKEAKKIAHDLMEYRISFLDAPVTGSTPKAITGELTIFVGGEKTIFEKVKPILAAMGQDIHYIGISGQGQAIKLVNNLLVASTIASLGEGMILADAEDLPRDKVVEVLANVPATSAFMKLKMPNFVSENYPTLFSVANMQKDLSLAEDEIKAKGISLLGLKRVNQLFREAIQMGRSNEDISAVFEPLKKASSNK